MIYVDELRDWGALCRGGRTCHLVSDTSVGELLDFAMKLGLSQWWLRWRRTQVPHYDLSASWRARAIAAGAIAVDHRSLVQAMRRLSGTYGT